MGCSLLPNQDLGLLQVARSLFSVAQPDTMLGADQEKVCSGSGSPHVFSECQIVPGVSQLPEWRGHEMPDLCRHRSPDSKN